VVQEDSYKNYFVIFEHSYKFLRILEVCPIFLKFKIIKNELKFAAQCWVERRLTIVRGEAACHAQPARGYSGALVGGLAAASQWQGSRLEHHRPTADAPGKKSGGEAHRGGGMMVGWRSRARSTTFGGDGAGTVVIDGPGVLLQLGEEGNE
jgi:hypothetical protein